VRAKTARPNRELPVVVDVEGGVVLARDVKAARESNVGRFYFCGSGFRSDARMSDLKNPEDSVGRLALPTPAHTPHVIVMISVARTPL
jgi:hypothetical protein